MNQALLVIDAQQWFVNKVPVGTRAKVLTVVDKIDRYINLHGQDYSFIYFTIFRNDPTSPLYRISKWHDCLRRPDIDLFPNIAKHCNSQNSGYKNILSAAKMPPVLRLLKQHQVTEVHLCGFDTDCCLLATAYDLFDLGIKPAIFNNLSWSTSKDKLHSAALKMIERNIGFITKAKL